MLKNILLIIFFLLLVSAMPVMAQTMMGDGTDSADMTVSVTPAPNDYVLPYPGMLPDNPLYFLKEIRDNVISFLISDPLKKADFDLLQADKSLQNGVALLTKKKASIALKSFDQEESYFTQAVSEVEKAQKQQLNTKDLLQKIVQSGEKHQDVLTETAKNLSGDTKKILLSHEQQITKLTDKATTLSSK